MKNLKKVLALVLVFASLFGLATMASATKSDDYSDAASITHVEAVDVMSTIGVFDGISGAFSGDSILTREQAAKIITYMILGKDDADALVASVAPYTDVARDRWSAGSIAYCKNQGILAGVGNGRFEPNGKLTGVAFAKMCLVALGYDPDVEGLTGPDWAVNTSKIAIADAGITGSLSQSSLADEMSREDACQMAFNTIQSNMVDYDSRGTNISVNGATISMSASKAKPVSVATGWTDTDRTDGHMWEANKQGQQLAGTTLNNGQDGIQQFAEKYFVNLKREQVQADSFGRPSTTWTFKADKIGTYVKESWLVKSWTTAAPKNEMYTAIGGSAYDKLRAPNAGNTNLHVSVDGYQPSGTAVDKDNYFAKSSSAAAGTAILDISGDVVNKGSKIGMTGNGVLTELYMNNSGEVWVALINTYLVQATGDYNSVTNRVNIEAMPIDEIDSDSDGHSRKAVNKAFLPTFISGDDFDVTGVKDGDYLLLNVSLPPAVRHEVTNSRKTTVEIITQANVQTASVTEYTEQEYVIMGGTKYSYNRILGEDEKGESFAINSDATLVLDSYGYIMYVAEAMNSSNFVYIDNFGGTSTTALDQTYLGGANFADGTTDAIKIAKIDGYKINSDTGAHDFSKYQSKGTDAKNKSTEDDHWYTHWYTFSGSSGGSYTLKTPDPKRYQEPHFVLYTYITGPDVTLIKSGTVRFMNEPNVNEYKTIADQTSTSAHNEPVVSGGKSTARGNEKTIFVVKNSDGDVNSYTGIANVPTVKLTAKSKNLTAKVSWINRVNSDYASYVFIDLQNTKADVDDGNNVADYMFTLKDTKHRTYVDGMSYLKYMVVIDGKEEERWISETIIGNSDAGILFKNIKEDSNGRITKGIQVASPDDSSQKGVYARMEAGNKDYITQKDSALRLNLSTSSTNVSGSWNWSSWLTSGTRKVADLYANSKSSINVVIKGDSGANADFLSDDGADYEFIPNATPSLVAGTFRDYDLSAQVYAVLTEKNGDVIDQMWIYVVSSTANPNH